LLICQGWHLPLVLFLVSPCLSLEVKRGTRQRAGNPNVKYTESNRKELL
jgi:hypothetical protein